MNPAPLVSGRNVFKIFNNRPILKNINCDFYPASINLVIGPNGCGKSTFLKLLAGLLKPDNGKITHYCSDVPAYLGHETGAYKNLTALENITFWSRAGKYPMEQNGLEKILADTGLQKHMNTPVRVFSRGMLQKLQIARLLLQKASLILLDEPLTGLDHDSRDYFIKILGDFRQNGACIILVTHEPMTYSRLPNSILSFSDHSFHPVEHPDLIPG